MHYAIDFGTSNTVVARINASGEPETIKFVDLSRSQNPPLVPSLVYVEDASSAQVLIGQVVCDRGLDFKAEPRFFQNFKRAIGTPVAGFVPELDGKLVSAEQVGTWFLRNLISQLPDPESLVLTVPVDSFEPYRQWLSGICEQLDINQIQILDEPTAAALGYGLAAGNETILVVDFGGGTLDLSLVKINAQVRSLKPPLGFLLKWGTKIVNHSEKPAIAKVIAKVGQNLGGIDIDHWLVDYFQTKHCLPKNSLITSLAEKLKIALSSSPHASEVFFDDRTSNSHTLELDRSQFQAILTQHKFFEQLDRALTQIHEQAQRQGVEPIDAVLLVGGTAQIPAVQAWAAQHFPLETIKFHKPFEAIAHGALSQKFELKDFLYHSYGVRYWNKRYRRHGWHPIIKAGQTYPSPAVELLLGASLANQPSIELVIGELGATTLEVYFEDDRLVTRDLDQTQVQILNDCAATIAQLKPLGQPGSDRLKVKFRVDQQRTLRITVEDLLSKLVLAEDVAVVKLI